MIVVDSSVWIDHLGGSASDATDRLDQTLDDGDVVPMLGVANALASADAYRALRERGVTVRKTIDVAIATRCLAVDLPLLFSDRDFEPFVEHLGLRAA